VFRNFCGHTLWKQVGENKKRIPGQSKCALPLLLKFPPLTFVQRKIHDGMYKQT
jgi:hypothetical protein